MMSVWDTKSRAEHFDGDDRFYKGDANVVLVDLKTKAVTTTGMGRAIGDYARWLTPGLLGEAVGDLERPSRAGDCVSG